MELNMGINCIKLGNGISFNLIYIGLLILIFKK